MIKSFNCKETEKLYGMAFSRKLPTKIQEIAYQKLKMLDNSSSVRDLMIPPSNKLEKLSGDRNGKYSIRINNQWRICFKWLNNDAYEVEIVDYH